MVERFLRQLMAAIDALHDLQRAEAGTFDGALLEPTHELLGLARQPQAPEGVRKA
jgi:hypothetical protein